MSADSTVDGLASVGNQRRVVRQTVVEPEEGSEVHVAVTDGHGDCLRPVERDEQHLVGRRVTVARARNLSDMVDGNAIKYRDHLNWMD